MIIVTGAGGTVGGEVVRQLQSAGAAFRGAYHSESKAVAARAQGIDAVALDFNEPESLDAAFRGADKLFLLSGGANQVEQESNAVEAAKRAGVKHIVKLSVIGAGEESFSFAKMHRAAEKAVEASGIAWTFLRPNGFMQNMENYSLPTIKSQNAFYSSVGDSKVAHVDVRDIAAVAVKALTEPGHESKAYTLTGPSAVSNHEIAQKLSESSGRSINYVDLSDADLRQGLIGSGMPDGYADAYLDLMRFYRSGDAAVVSDDIRRVTGREPIAFEQYARDRGSAFA
jgi:uncharacterized protein YbjT (DUF2867 family)